MLPGILNASISLNKNEIRKYRIMAKQALIDIIIKNDIDIDVIIDSGERIWKRIRIGDLFMKEIIEKGKVIYGKYSICPGMD